MLPNIPNNIDGTNIQADDVSEDIVVVGWKVCRMRKVGADKVNKYGGKLKYLYLVVTTR